MSKTKEHKFLLSANDWEYSMVVKVIAKECEVFWSSDKANDRWGNNDDYNDGNALIADGVKIVFDEPLQRSED